MMACCTNIIEELYKSYENVNFILKFGLNL